MRHPIYRPIAALIAILVLVLAGCGATGNQTTARPTPAGPSTINGITLPPDAAPPEQQVLQFQYGKELTITTLDFFETVYGRFNNDPTVSDLFSDPLVRVNKNYLIVPGAATKWEIDKAGTTWTFHLDPNLMWSDDTPVTADDYVATFRYGADSKHAWDFNWFFSGVIKNWDEAVAGKVPTDQIGVRAVDAHTLQFETVAPAPYLSAMLIYSTPFQKKALEKHGGGKYNSDPATAVSSGPFVLKSWQADKFFVLEANPKYKGTNKPFIQKIIVTKTDKDSDFEAYMKHEIDFIDGKRLSSADLDKIVADPELSKQLHVNYGDFRTYYLFFDMQNPPFNNLKVRQAFSHVVDRDSLINNIIKPINAIPAYSYLMPGFPASDPDAYKNIQTYDLAKAKQLLAEAGFPDGKGFPKLTMWMRQEAPVFEEIGKAIAANLKELGIEVEVANKPRAEFSEALNAKPTKIQFGLISYGMDFLDPYNMMSVFLSGGRHNWNNAKFDEMVKKAASFTGDTNERIKMFQETERLLVDDVGGVFILHRTLPTVYKPYLVGSELEPDNVGVSAIHFPGYSSFSAVPGSLYISKDVTKYRTAVPQEPKK